VTLFGTASYPPPWEPESEFLYALQRDLVWDGYLRRSQGGDFRFYTPFGVTLFGTFQVLPAPMTISGVKFLYALRRDLVWDLIVVDVAVKAHGDTFLYALRRDLVWDLPWCPSAASRPTGFYTPFGVTLFGTRRTP